MTSQIAVFNLGCVAVASDSVMTVSQGVQSRTLESSEKVFDLGDGHRVVVLSSGETRFMRVPYAVLLGEWQASLAGPLPSLADYPRALAAWLAGRADLVTEDDQNRYFHWQLQDFYLMVRAEILREVEEAELSDAPWDDQGVQRIAGQVIDRLLSMIDEREDLPDIDGTSDAGYLVAQWDAIKEAFEEVFDDTPRTVDGDVRLRGELPALILAKDEPWSSDSTLAFIGYGQDDVFPGHQVVNMHGLVNGQIRASWWSPCTAELSNPAFIVPFGQVEAIHTFLHAYNTDFLTLAHDRIEQVIALANDGKANEDSLDWPAIRESAHRDLNDDFLRLSRERFTDPMLDTVESLPRADMARMAEALVGVQALRAASSRRQPSVGGPIDVLVISRRHGVQWLRRKELTLD